MWYWGVVVVVEGFGVAVDDVEADTDNLASVACGVAAIDAVVESNECSGTGTGEGELFRPESPLDVVVQRLLWRGYYSERDAAES